MSDNINEVLIDTAAEPKVVELDDSFEQPQGGAWPKGWYTAEVLEGYSTPKGTVFTTTDGPSKQGDSRNLRLCFKVSKGNQTRNLQQVFNYRTTDFAPARIAQIKAMREEFKDELHWPDKDAQRTNLALVNFKQFGNVLGHGVQLSEGNTVLTPQFLGLKCEVYLGTDAKGYNQVNNVRPIVS